MATQIFINLPVADLPRSMAFFRRSAFTSTNSSPTTQLPAW